MEKKLTFIYSSKIIKTITESYLGELIVTESTLDIFKTQEWNLAKPLQSNSSRLSGVAFILN